MKLTLRLDPKSVRRWHVSLADALSRRPVVQVGVEWNLDSESLPSAVPLLFALEQLVYGLPPDDTKSVTAAELGRFVAASEAPDLVLDFTAAVPNANRRDTVRT